MGVTTLHKLLHFDTLEQKRLLKNDPFNSDFQEAFPVFLKYVNYITKEGNQTDLNTLPKAAHFLEGMCKIYSSQVDDLCKTVLDGYQKIQSSKNKKKVAEKLQKQIKEDKKLLMVPAVRVINLTSRDILKLQYEVRKGRFREPEMTATETSDVNVPCANRKLENNDIRESEVSIIHCESSGFFDSGIDCPVEFHADLDSINPFTYGEIPIDNLTISNEINNGEPIMSIQNPELLTIVAVTGTQTEEPVFLESDENITFGGENFAGNGNEIIPPDAEKQDSPFSVPESCCQEETSVEGSTQKKRTSYQFYRKPKKSKRDNIGVLDVNEERKQQEDVDLPCINSDNEVEGDVEICNVPENELDYEFHAGNGSRRINDVCNKLVQAAKQICQLQLDQVDIKSLTHKEFKIFMKEKRIKIVSTFSNVVQHIRDDPEIWTFCSEEIEKLEKAIEEQSRLEEFDIKKRGKRILENVENGSSNMQYRNQGALTPFSTTSYGDSGFGSQSRNSIYSRHITSDTELSDTEMEHDFLEHGAVSSPSRAPSCHPLCSTPISSHRPSYSSSNSSNWVPMSYAFTGVQVSNAEVARTFSALLQELHSKNLALDFDKVQSAEAQKKVSKMLTQDQLTNLNESQALKVMTSSCASLTSDKDKGLLQVCLTPVLDARAFLHGALDNQEDIYFVDKDINQKLSEFVDDPGKTYEGSLQPQRKRKYNVT